MRRPPFDPRRAAFILLAGVLIVQSMVIIGMTGACIWNAETLFKSSTDCDPHNRLAALLSAALAAALAFAGTRGKDDK